VIAVNKASRHGVEALSKKLLKLLEDKSSQLYQDNVAKFGIPEELVKKAFSEETLLEAVDSGRAVFYLALENKCKILGFAQVVPVDLETAELDRIVVFPENTRKGLGTKLLTRALGDQEKKGLKRVIVKAGKDEKHARRFYEKNGFTFVKEETLEAPWGKIELAVYQRSLKQHS
jgi:N-acetylglutamate synthase-like GNAT family acetyltransferase